MIVIEGPDGAGKTVLARKLCELYDLEYRRPPTEVLSSSEGPTGGTALIDWWREEITKCRYKLSYKIEGVYDRTTYISDPIYRLAMGGRPQGTVQQMSDGLWYIINYASLIVFCLPPFDKTMENIHADGRDKLPVSDDDLYNIYMAYQVWYTMMREANYDTVGKYDYTVGDSDWWRIKNFVGQKVLGKSIHDTVGKG